MFFFYLAGDHRDLHVLTPSCPPRPSSDLIARQRRQRGQLLFDRIAQRRDRDLWGAVRAADGFGNDPVDHLEPEQVLRRHFHRRGGIGRLVRRARSEEHTSELQSLMRISYAVFCLKKKKKTK